MPARPRNCGARARCGATLRPAASAVVLLSCTSLALRGRVALTRGLPQRLHGATFGRCAAGRPASVWQHGRIRRRVVSGPFPAACPPCEQTTVGPPMRRRLGPQRQSDIVTDKCCSSTWIAQGSLLSREVSSATHSKLRPARNPVVERKPASFRKHLHTRHKIQASGFRCTGHDPPAFGARRMGNDVGACGCAPAGKAPTRRDALPNAHSFLARPDSAPCAALRFHDEGSQWFPGCES